MRLDAKDLGRIFCSALRNRFKECDAIQKYSLEFTKPFAEDGCEDFPMGHFFFWKKMQLL